MQRGELWAWPPSWPVQAVEPTDPQRTLELAGLDRVGSFPAALALVISSEAWLLWPPHSQGLGVSQVAWEQSTHAHFLFQDPCFHK